MSQGTTSLSAQDVHGFIADAEGDVSQFPVSMDTLAALFGRYPETCPVHLRESLGVSGAARRFDTAIMGRKTYAPALAAGLTAGAYPHLRQIVVTGQPMPPGGTVETMTGDVAAQVAQLRSQPGRDIWLCGGADLARQLIDDIDEIEVKINPILVGRGIPLLGDSVTKRLDLVDASTLPGGVLLATYRPRDRVAAGP